MRTLRVWTLRSGTWKNSPRGAAGCSPGSRRSRLLLAMEAIRAYEASLSRYLLQELSALDGSLSMELSIR